MSWSAAKSFYALLGVDEKAEEGDIGRAYRRLARKLHPDMQSGSPQGFIAVTEAYEVLSSARTRAEYDRHRAAMREAEQVQRAREQAAADAAARAAREERLRREAAEKAAREAVRMRREAEARRIQEQEVLRRRQAADAATRRAQPTPGGWSVTITWSDSQLRDMYAMPGQDHVVTIIGQPGFQRHGFSFTAPIDGGRITLPAGLAEGDYTFPERGQFAPFGGPRGNLIMRYRWPDPIPGDDLPWRIERRGRNRWRPGTFKAPVTGDECDIPAGAGDTTLTYRGQGMAGEYGGPPGDLLVDIVFGGHPRRRSMHLILAGVTALWRFAVWTVGTVIVVFVVLGVALLLWDHFGS